MTAYPHGKIQHVMRAASGRDTYTGPVRRRYPGTPDPGHQHLWVSTANMCLDGDITRHAPAWSL